MSQSGTAFSSGGRHATGRRRRLVAVAFQGFGNLGDEAILTGVESLLFDSGLDVVTVLGGNRAPIAGFPSVERLTSRRLMPSVAALRRLVRADALLVTGGGLLHDHWRVVLLRYLTWVLAARLLRKPVCWLGVGVGPLRRRSWRFLAQLTTRMSHLVLVRDEGSAALLREIRGRVDGVIPDPAFFNQPVERQPPEGDVQRRHAPLGLVVRQPAPRGERYEEALVESLAEVAARTWGREHRATVIFTFAGERDRPLAERVAAGARQKGAGEVAVEGLPPDPAMGMARLAACDMVISVRLHGLILASIVGVPFVGVAYDDKVTGVLAGLDAADLSVPLSEVESDRLLMLVARARQNDVQTGIRLALERMRGQRASIVALLQEALA